MATEDRDLRILITNHRLGGRAGVQSFVRDLARGLQARGHIVMAYTSDLAQGARLLENDLVPVVTDLEGLQARPDIIHAQHHLDAMTALALLPGVPAIYHSHGAIWRDSPPRHPRIHKYLAVAASARERMLAETNLSPDEVDVLPNGVDLARFRRVRTLPARPARALFYNSRHEAESETVTAIREAVARANLPLDLAGYHFNTPTDRPDQLLPAYDLVFASGISAMEALACGCAVVVLGRSTCGELVTPDNLERYRQANFSAAANAEPPGAGHVLAQIARYDQAACAEVTRRARTEMDFGRVVDRLVTVYEEAIARHRATPPDPTGEMRAMGHYLRWIVPIIKLTDEIQEREWGSATRAESFHDLRAELTGLGLRLDRAMNA